jgi:DNA polymerase-3 subunit beta
MIKQTVFSVATDESKITMTGELFEIKDDKLRLVAIDGFRIAMREIKTESICTEQIKKIVPGKTLKEMIKILPSEKEEIIGLYFNDKTMMLETAEFTLVSRLLDGEFMNYEGIINAEYNTVATVSRPDFLTSIARCTIISGKDTKKPPIKLNIGESRVAVSSQTEFGNCYDEIAAEITGAELEMGFNPRYLADALSAIDEDFVSLRLNTPLSPCMIVSEENSAFVYLVLPLRLK